MKKTFLLAILMVLAFATDSYAVTNTFTVASGNHWSTTYNWSQGHVPVDGENVVLSGIVVWDVATVPRIPATGRLGSITSAGAYAITLDMDDEACHGDPSTCALYAASMTAGPVTGGFLVTSGAQTDHSVTIDVTGDIASGATASDNNLYHAGAGKMIIVVGGNLKGSAGGSCFGFINFSTGTFTINGNVLGGGGALGGGVSNSTGTGTITGNVTGGTHVSSPGVNASGTGVITLIGNMIATSTSRPWAGTAPSWDVANAKYYYQLSTGIKLYADTDPGVANVKTGTSYYFQSNTIKNGTAGGGGGAWGF